MYILLAGEYWYPKGADDIIMKSDDALYAVNIGRFLCGSGKIPARGNYNPPYEWFEVLDVETLEVVCEG